MNTKQDNIFTKLRKKKNLTQPELAKKVDASEGFISLLENKKKDPSLKMIKKLEEVLGSEIRNHFF